MCDWMVRAKLNQVGLGTFWCDRVWPSMIEYNRKARVGWI